MSTGLTDTTTFGVRSTAEGGIVAELRLDHADLTLRPSLRRVSEITVEPEQRTVVDADRHLLFFTARGGAFDAFETALESDPTVDDPVLVDRFADRRVYRVALADGTIRFVPKVAEFGGRVVDSTGHVDGWTVTLRLPDRDSLVSFNEFCRDRDITFQVNHLRTADECERAVVGLTPKQQELLTVAYEEGYFDVPRGISQNELADRLDVSKSAISQRLRRAIDELCGATLSRSCGREPEWE